jgi:hypothetical protein
MASRRVCAAATVLATLCIAIPGESLGGNSGRVDTLRGVHDLGFEVTRPLNTWLAAHPLALALCAALNTVIAGGCVFAALWYVLGPAANLGLAVRHWHWHVHWHITAVGPCSGPWRA